MTDPSPSEPVESRPDEALIEKSMDAPGPPNPPRVALCDVQVGAWACAAGPKGHDGPHEPYREPVESREQPRGRPCNDFPSGWRGEHEPHDYEGWRDTLHCPGVSYTREQRWDQALGDWMVVDASDGGKSIVAAPDEYTRAECIALADHEAAAALAEVSRLREQGEAVMAERDRARDFAARLEADTTDEIANLEWQVDDLLMGDDR